MKDEFTTHEAMHMASVLVGMTGDYLIDNRAVAAKPEWLALATAAHDALLALYQAIGAEHLASDAVAAEEKIK